ncbi:hypothetical protein [Micromonospora sp. NPDC002717]|uniref:hypothetical protein n=1 Tax=Micromonospora sp. NPDC002717 TaxID=3154424 RepID=UPI0033253C54
MSRSDEPCGPADRYASARMTEKQHADGSTCFHCQPDGSCEQNAWAQQELARHPGRHAEAPPAATALDN